MEINKGGKGIRILFKGEKWIWDVYSKEKWFWVDGGGKLINVRNKTQVKKGGKFKIKFLTQLIKGRGKAK